MNLFVYGTLQSPQAMMQLVGRSDLAAPVPAALDGYALTWRTYLSAFPCKRRTVQGWLYRGLRARDLKKLDAYENVQSGLYTRNMVTVQTLFQDASESVEAFVYVGGPYFNGEK